MSRRMTKDMSIITTRYDLNKKIQDTRHVADEVVYVPST